MANSTFDFEEHVKQALSSYIPLKPRYHELARKITSIINEALAAKSIGTHSVTYRIKSDESFAEKVRTPDSQDSRNPKYPDPLKQITDLAGVRVITYFLNTQEDIDKVIAAEFDIIEKVNHTEKIMQTQHFGYLSVHYIVKLKHPRVELTEYREFKDLLCEIQVRTILQHAWAEIEHDIQYKSEVDIPPMIRRRFASIASMLEAADRDFQFIHDEDERYHQELTERIDEGTLENLEITASSVKLLLAKLFRTDLRVSDWNYSWLARMTLKLGVKDISQLEQILSNEEHYKALQRNLWSVRPSPPTIAEDLLLLHFKEKFIETHTLSKEPWFVNIKRKMLTQALGQDTLSTVPNREQV